MHGSHKNLKKNHVLENKNHVLAKTLKPNVIAIAIHLEARLPLFKSKKLA